MPLDSLQSKVLRVISRNRSIESAFAGGSVLHRHAFRLSDDQDIFHPTEHDILAEAQRDVDALLRAGFDAERTMLHEGIVEYTIFSEGEHPTKLQWTQSGSWTFFEPVPDDTFGRRLHLVDIAVNKVLAGAGRKVARDFVDIRLVHEKILPIWHAVWSAPGKDASWNPTSLIEALYRHNQFSQREMDAEVASLIELDAADIMQAVKSSLDEARGIVERFPRQMAGRLFVNIDTKEPCNDPDQVLKGISNGSVRAIEPELGGQIPSNTNIDRQIMDSFVLEYGADGSLIP